MKVKDRVREAYEALSAEGARPTTIAVGARARCSRAYASKVLKDLAAAGEIQYTPRRAGRPPKSGKDDPGTSIGRVPGRRHEEQIP